MAQPARGSSATEANSDSNLTDTANIHIQEMLIVNGLREQQLGKSDLGLKRDFEHY
jgi:hypothetical protein